MTNVVKDNGRRSLPFDEARIIRFIDSILEEFPHLKAEDYKARIVRSIASKEEFVAEEITNRLILNAQDLISKEEPDWTFVAARIYLKKLYKQAAYNRSYDASEKYGDFIGLLKKLGELGIYSEDILREYSKQDIKEAEKLIDPSKDNLFTYAGLRTFADRYLAGGYSKEVFELPQERYLIIALTLMMNEPEEKRLELIKEAYWALSNHYMITATPTTSNAGKSYGQLSSCFIDTVDDSLRGIYDSNTDSATLSKASGGLGIYLGKIRSSGSDIKGFKGASSGVIPWAKQLNNTAVSVDQLGTRQGSIAVYLDLWHKDIFTFLDGKLNNGDERFKFHDLFTGVCIPDLFMEQVEKRGDWYLFDPHEVRKVMGWKDKNGKSLSLEDFYDEEDGWGSFREKYEECIQCNELSKVKTTAIEIMKRIMKSQLETGTPYMFYRDTVNRANPNKHAGMIYASNLCTEIMQNMSATTVKSEYTEDGEIVIRKSPGDYVVCNLSSIHLGRAVPAGVLERLIPIQMRMLDNVIDLNNIEVLQAQITNQKYRAVGLGYFSWHHLLALKSIKWDSEDAVNYSDELFEKIAFLAIKASNDLAKEKGYYPEFKGSEWDTGKYFERRDYTNDSSAHDWDGLRESIKQYGMRNGYLQSPAPNGSTAILINGTQATYPIFSTVYYEEKKNYKLKIAVPDLNPKTFWYYVKNAYQVDQHMSIKQNAARQRHVDQSISFNLYVPNNIKAKDLLALHMDAWESKLKTTYYTKSTSIELEDCDACQ